MGRVGDVVVGPGVERICDGFTAGSWGRPSRVFRFVPETFERIRAIG